jgi:hypothetical protein
MPAMKRLHILLSGPRGETPALEKLLARGRPTEPSAPGLSAALSRLFGLDRAAVAPILLTAEGIEPGAGQWFRADPVHMLAGMHSLSLLDSHRFNLTASEASALIDALNTHFADIAEFVAPHPLRWYARLNAALDVTTPPLDQVTGIPIEPKLIGGPDATKLHGLTMEIQMLLHDHPVNDAREEQGELPINGVWFWGGGARQPPVVAFDRVLARDFSCAALAQATGISCCQPPERLGIEPGNTLMALDASLDAGLFEDILDELKRGRLDEVVIEAVGVDEAARRLTPWSAWKVWVRPGRPD